MPVYQDLENDNINFRLTQSHYSKYPLHLQIYEYGYFGGIPVFALYSDILIEGHNADLGVMTISIIMKDMTTGLEVDLPFEV